MKILFLAPYPLNEAPSQRFRFEHFLNLFSQYGHQYHFQSFWNLSAWKVLYKKGHFIEKVCYLLAGFVRRLSILPVLHQYNYIFIHREVTPLGPPVFEFVISKIFKKPVIYDFDDAIWLYNTSEANKVVSFLKYHHKVNDICKWAYRISAGNPFLAQHAQKFNNNVSIIPTVVDTENYHYQLKQHKNRDTITIGWTGTHSTSIYLDKIVPVLRELSSKYKVELNVISNQPPDIDEPFVQFIPWSQKEEIEQLLQFDIGIMPLDDTDWEKGKCGFKAIQYMALGIPCVASPVGVNNTLIINGENGYLAHSLSQWSEYLSELIESISLREQIGSKARGTIIQKFSVEAIRDNFFSLFA